MLGSVWCDSGALALAPKTLYIIVWHVAYQKWLWLLKNKLRNGGVEVLGLWPTPLYKFCLIGLLYRLQEPFSVKRSKMKRLSLVKPQKHTLTELWSGMEPKIVASPGSFPRSVSHCLWNFT
jgi:hypothetical protein